MAPCCCRLLEDLQNQLTGLVEHLSLYLALLPGSDILLNLSPDQFTQATSSVPALPDPSMDPLQPAISMTAQQEATPSTSSRRWFTTLPRGAHQLPTAAQTEPRADIGTRQAATGQLPAVSQLPSTSSAAIEALSVSCFATSPSSGGHSSAVAPAAGAEAVAAAGPKGSSPNAAAQPTADLLSMSAALRSITSAHAPADGSLNIPGGTSWLQKQFTFAVAVHEQAHLVRQLLQQLRRAKRMLLHAGRTGKSCRPCASCIDRTGKSCHSSPADVVAAAEAGLANASVCT